MSSTNEKNVDPVQIMARIAQNYLDVGSWGFKESFRTSQPGKLIYDSEWCRLNLVWGGWDPLGGNSMSIYYGRLHAPNEGTTMMWYGERCYCWHRFELALHLLDGKPPEEASRMIYTHRLIEEYKRSEIGKSLTGKQHQPEWLAEMHRTIWHHYGRRLLELFDLRRPDLWQQYQQFIKSVYDIEGRFPEIEPPLDKVC